MLLAITYRVIWNQKDSWRILNRVNGLSVLKTPDKAGKSIFFSSHFPKFRMHSRYLRHFNCRVQWKCCIFNINVFPLLLRCAQMEIYSMTLRSYSLVVAQHQIISTLCKFVWKHGTYKMVIMSICTSVCLRCISFSSLYLQYIWSYGISGHIVKWGMKLLIHS